MINHVMDSRFVRTLAALGAGWGIMGAVGLGVLRFANSVPANMLDQVPGSTAFALVYLVPFALAVLAFRWQTLRGGIWLAAGLLGLMGMFTAFSGVTLILFPAAALLIFAGAVHLVQNRGHALPLTMLVIVGMLLFNGLAFRALFLREDGRCWEQIRTDTGDVVWRSAPYHQSGSASATGNGVIGTTCDSDVISLLESGLAIGLLVVEISGATLIGRTGNQKAAA